MLDSQGFDLWADGYDKSVGLADEENEYPFAGYKEVLNTIYNEVLRKESAKVLDIGFGTGVLTSRLYDRGCWIWGVDFSSRMIELAKVKMPEAQLVQADFSKELPQEIREQQFDCIIATYSLHHLTDDQKVEFLESLKQVLRKGGRILIGDVAFTEREALEACREAVGDGWDADEIYFVYEELKDRLSYHVEYQQISHCAGVFAMEMQHG